VTADRAALRRQFDQAVARDQYRLSPLGGGNTPPMTVAEIERWTSVAEEHLRVAQDRHVHQRYPATALAEVYEGCVVAANALVAAFGYVSKGESGHDEVLRAASGLLHALGRRAESELLDTVRTCLRRLRHMAVYDNREIVTAQDVDRAVGIATQVVPVMLDEVRATVARRP